MDMATVTQIINLFDRLGSTTASADLRVQFCKVEREQRLSSPLLDQQGRLSPEGRKFRKSLRTWMEGQQGINSLIDGEVCHSSGYALVIGSAHLDVYGDYPEEQHKYKDKVGCLSYSVGGSAFNIAANLASQDVPVALYTYLPKDSLATNPIMRNCTDLGIDKRFIHLTQQREEVGFLAHRYKGDLESAVTATLIDKIDLDESNLSKAIEGCKFMVIECNLSEQQICQITQLAAKASKQVLAGGVSDAKAIRIQNAYLLPGNSFALELFMLNELEAERAFMADETNTSAKQLCRKARSNTVAVTKGSRGFQIYNHDGTSKQFEVQKIERFISVSGAGDALLAAACKCYYQDGSLEWELVARAANTMIDRVLKTGIASPVPTAFQEAPRGETTIAEKVDSNEFAKRLRQLQAEKLLNYGNGYTCVTKFGTTYTLTASQAICIQCLWENYANGTPDIRAESILEKIGNSGMDVDPRCASKILYENIWKRNRDKWLALVTEGETKGTFRLNVEKESRQKRDGKKK